MKIDAFTHALPGEFQQAVLQRAKNAGSALASWEKLETLLNMDLRVAMMDEFEVDMQVLTTASPPLEQLFDAQTATALARVANDGMAELVQHHPGRFLGVATVSLLDPEQAAVELQRSIRGLGLSGVLVYSNVAGRPLDAPELDVFYTAAEGLDVPIWLHPDRPEWRADYIGEDRSRYGLYLVFGWPYDTTLAMARMVFGGVLHRHPRLKVIAHHAGGMLPFFARRVEKQYPETRDFPRIEFPQDVEGPYLDHFRRFYVDTVTGGSVSALMNAYELFGADHMLFASDVPYGRGSGRDFLRDALESVRHMPIPPREKDRIWSGTLLQLCRVNVS